MTRKIPVALAAAALACPAAAQAEPAVGVLAGGTVLAGFDTATPGTFASLKQITGLAPGERVAAVDYRYLPPAGASGPGLFALGIASNGSTSRLYRIDEGTGLATPVSPGAVTIPLPGTRFGFDFSPAADRIRVVNENDENLRLNPNNSAVAGDDDQINPAPYQVTGIAYDRVHLAPAIPPTPGATTAYAIHAGGQLGTLGSLNGVPTSPNLGGFTVIGPLGVVVDPNTGTDFDIGFGGTAYAALTSGGAPGLYTINLATGAATLIGSTPMALTGLAVVPSATVAFAASATSAGESAGSAAVAVSRSGSLTSTTSVAWSASSGPSGTVTFAPGETGKTISVPVANDAIDEPDEAVALTLSSPSHPATLAAPSSATLTIVDDDAPPTTPDAQAPALTVAKLPKSIGYRKLRADGIRFTVTPSEAASLEAALLGTTRAARLSAFNLALATKRLPLAAGARTVTLKPSRRALRRPRKAVRLRIQITATDASRNSSVLRRTVKLKPR